MFQFYSPKILSRNLLNHESYRPFGGPVSSARVSAAASKEGRLSRRQERTAENAFFEKEEGGLYGPGIADVSVEIL